MIDLTIVYVPINVEDELPPSGTWCLCDEDRYLLYDGTIGWMHSSSLITAEDERPKIWWKKQESVNFTEEEYKNHIRSIIEDSLTIVAENAKMKFYDGHHKENSELTYFQSGINNLQISKKSILDCMESLLEKWQISDPKDFVTKNGIVVDHGFTNKLMIPKEYFGKEDSEYDWCGKCGRKISKYINVHECKNPCPKLTFPRQKQ
jgi:hypothetical protein